MTANSCGYCSSSSRCVNLAFQDAEAVLFSGDEVSINTPGGGGNLGTSGNDIIKVDSITPRN